MLGPKPLFEKHPAVAFGIGRPDLDVVHPAHIIKGAKADESPFERHVVSDHNRGEHIIEVKGDCRFLDIPDNADLSPLVYPPIYAYGAKIGDWRPRRFVYYEHVVSVVIAGLGDVDIHVVAGIFEAEKEAVIPMGVAASFCGIRILLHKLSDWGSFDAALQNIDLKNETAEGYTLDEGDVVGRAVGRFVFASADESEDLIAPFLEEFPSGPIGHHECIEGGFGSQRLLVL